MSEDARVHTVFNEYYDPMMTRLAELGTNHQREDGEVEAFLRRDAWRQFTQLFNRRTLYQARFSAKSNDRCRALRQYVHTCHGEALYEIEAIIGDLGLPADIRFVAEEAAKTLRARNETVVSDMFAQRLEELLHGPPLDNFQGYLCARVADASGKALKARSGGELRACSGQTCEMTVWLQPSEPRRRLAEWVSICSGQDVEEVTFRVALDSESVKVKPSGQGITVSAAKRSPNAMFSLTMPKTSGEHQIWITLHQKRQIIQTLNVTFVLAQP